MTFEEDLTEFFDDEEHATAATIDGVAVVGIFAEVPASDDSVEGSRKAFRVRAAVAPPLPADRSGIAVVIGATTYTAHEVYVQDDLAWLLLQED